MNKEIALALLALIDSQENSELIDMEYLGQGVHKIYIWDRDELARIVKKGEDSSWKRGGARLPKVREEPEK